MYPRIFLLDFLYDTVYCNKCRRWIKKDYIDKHECYKKAMEFLSNLDCKVEIILSDNKEKNFKWRD